MRASMLKKSLIIGIVFFLLLLLAGNASSETEPIYAGWTVGDSWDGYGTILRSTDSGNTWIRQGEGQIANVGMGGVFAVDPYKAWVVGDPDSGYATIYHTTDGGTTWERKGSPDPSSPDYVPNSGLAKVHAAGDDVWIVGGATILHTSDNGATWTNHIPSGYEDIPFQGVYVLDSNTVWVTGGPDKPEDGQGVILKTTDAGLTWTRQMGGDVADAEYLLGISAADANTAWAVGRPYIVLKTIDGGATWTRDLYFSDDPTYQYDINEVYAVSTSTVWVASDFSIYWSTNGGHSWDSAFNDDLAFMGISAVSAQKAWGSHVYRTNVGYIAYTTDGGTTWTTIDQLDGEALPNLWNISFATRPINLNDMITSLIGDVELLVDDGLLNKGQGNALIVKLEHALDRLADDRLKAAINTLEAFLNQVDAFVRGGVLPSEIGQPLSNQVNDIIELL